MWYIRTKNFDQLYSSKLNRMIFFIFWILFSFIVGSMGSSRKIGFAGAFFLSLLLSPLIGVIFTATSKSLQEEAMQLDTQRNIKYSNFVNARNANPDNFTLPDLHGEEKFVKIHGKDIPNSEIGKPLIFKSYKVKDGKTVKEAKHVAIVHAGNKRIIMTMPYEGTIRRIHNPDTFLMPDDPVYIIS